MLFLFAQCYSPISINLFFIYPSIKSLFQHFSDLKASQICLITPYSGQIKLYHNLTRHLMTLPQWRRLRLDEIRLSTVDGVQGQECDIIIGDLVREGIHGDIGFIRDPNRLNALFSRAKMVSAHPQSHLCFHPQCLYCFHPQYLSYFIPTITSQNSEPFIFCNIIIIAHVPITKHALKRLSLELKRRKLVTQF